MFCFAERGLCDYPVTKYIQVSAGQDIEQPGLAEGVPAYGTGLELGDI